MELSVISIIVAILVPVLGYWLFVDRRITRLETKMDPLWRVVETRLPELLHSPDPAHKQMDDLLEKFQAKEISEKELCDLHQLMVTRLKKVNPGRQVQYMLLMARIEQIIEEREAEKKSWKKRIGLSR